MILIIDLSKVRYVFFDFDDTLCIHKNRQFLKYEDYIKLLYQEKENISLWSPNDKSQHMQRFMDLCFSKYISMYLISWVKTSLESNIKQKWVFKTYGYLLENMCVGSIELKTEIIQYFCSAKNISTDSVLIIDDSPEVLNNAAKNNIQAASPMEIVSFIDSINLKI